MAFSERYFNYDLHVIIDIENVATNCDLEVYLCVYRRAFHV
jgi:hypothetical protein